ncbi:hypothetical protein Glove_415g30 [Diversispora epigaea]|uniref:BZIP domain-containing protein n=1 Tax=Diversispora epigaea TaxID=1348612 RepID=A0A397GYN0_9GLOM|nr:hypothetical protein Glove_415g30 [Diversispora epigaea]
MSSTNPTTSSMTVAAGHHGYTEYDCSSYNSNNNSRRTTYDENVVSPGRRLTVQELLAEPPVRSSESPYSTRTSTPSPTEPPNSTIMQHYNHQVTSPHHHITRYSQSPPTLPLPLPSQQQTQQLLCIPSAQQQQQQQSGMEIESFKLTLPTPLTSPTPGPTISMSSVPSVQPLHHHQYSPTTPNTNTTTNTTSQNPSSAQEDNKNTYMNTIPTTNMIMPLSLSERRERNKVASAKYRAKKHKQNQEMSTQISELNSENNVISRQLEELKAENAELKELVDKLKSKLVEGKILKRLGRGAKLSSGTAVTSATIGTTEGLTTLTATVRKGSTKRNGFSSHAKGTGPSQKTTKK